MSPVAISGASAPHPTEPAAGKPAHPSAVPRQQPVQESPGEPIQEIMEYVPGGLLRWGTTALAAMLAVLLVISCLLSYPDVVRGRFMVTPSQPPVRVVTRVSGEVERIFVREGEHVAHGRPLVAFRNPTRYEDVVGVSTQLDRLDQALNRGGPLPELDARLMLGELQSEYAELLQRLSDYRSLEAEDRFFGEKAAALGDQVRNHERLSATVQSQQALLEEDVKLSGRELARLRQLQSMGLVAPTQVEAAEQAYLQRRVAAENGRAALSRSQIEVSAFRSSALDLQRQQEDGRRSRVLELRNAVQKLRTGIAGWEAQYVIRAPMDGRVSFFREIHEAQYFTAYDPVVAVLPESRNVTGSVQLDERDAGKVRSGQRVILRFDSYPFREYGTVTGVVESISRLGMTGEQDRLLYRVEVRLPSGLRTSYNQQLEPRQELRGDADIVTADRRLIQRFFDQLRLAQ